MRFGRSTDGIYKMTTAEKLLAFMLTACMLLYTVAASAMAYEFCYTLNENMLGGFIPYVMMGFGAPMGAFVMWLYNKTVNPSNFE